MEYSLQHLIDKTDGYVRCSLCGASVEGPVWPHFAYGCQKVADDFSNESIQITSHLALRALEDIRLGIDQAFWLRGLSELRLPDPFNRHYNFSNSWGSDRLDVTGCVLGSDGSGGKQGRQIRTRMCGFGLAIFRITSATTPDAHHQSGEIHGQDALASEQLKNL